MKCHVDFETRSALDLKIVGLDNYSRNCNILMLAWAINDEPVNLWQPHLGPPPDQLLELFYDKSVIICAWNASFERSILHRQLGIWVDYDRWSDAMIYARYLSLPGALSDFAERLGLPIGHKIADGKRLIKLFSVPIRPKRKRAAKDENVLFAVSPLAEAQPVEVRFNDWNSHPEDWRLFGEYCQQDVVAERDAANFAEKYFPLPEIEIRGWKLDQKINQVGMPADDKFAENSVILAQQAKDNALAEQKAITGLENPNSNSQMLKWVRERGFPGNSLRKEPVKIALESGQITDKECLAVLALRGESAKTSYTKLKKIRSAIGPDGRLRNQFLYLGSARSGRWSGKDAQLHNMARPVKELEEQETLDLVRDSIYKLDYNGIKKIYPSVLTAITSCIRSTFVAKPGKQLNVCDLNAIETRVAAWFCQCESLMQVFRDGRDPYLDFASQMYQVDYEQLKRAYEAKDPDAKTKRQVAKSGVLGCVYRLAGGEWKKNRYGDMVKGGLWGYAESMGVKMDKELAHTTVAAFRSIYKEIKFMWYALESATEKVLTKGGRVKMGPEGCVIVGRKNRKDKLPILYIQLPSGRRLHYVDAHLVEKEWQGKDGPYLKTQMVYRGISQETKQWEEIDTNGGKQLEHIAQGIARDVLLNGMLLYDGIGGTLTAHVHDELVAEENENPLDTITLNDLKWAMSQTPVWAPGFVVTAEGFTSQYYRKG